MLLNIEQLRADLETYITGLTSSSDVEDVMVITAALDTLTTDRVNSLDLINDLPEAYDVSPGTIFFVKEINTLVYASAQNKWKGLDGRVLREDPVVALAWGFSANGRLGINSDTNHSSPVTVAGGITTWSSISAGDSHNLGLTNGIAYAWGNNNVGKLGDNTLTNRSSPVTVVGGITNWSQVSAGRDHSLGIAGGIAYAWGSNGQGSLGDNTIISKRSPITVIGGITNWSQVSAGGLHSLGIANGVVYGWGYNGQGCLGDGTTIDKSSPVTVIGGITNWSQVSAGTSHSLGVTGSGILYAWGINTAGVLGDDTLIDRSSPVTVVGGITNWTQVSAGLRHNFGIREDGTLWAWGSNGNGRLGDGTTIDKSSPVTAVGGITNWNQVSAGSYHGLGIANGAVYAWGSNPTGILGDDTIIEKSSPVTVVGGITTWAQVGAGLQHSLALKAD